MLLATREVPCSLSRSLGETSSVGSGRVSVAFVSGTFVLTDTLANVFDGLFTDVNRGVDVAIRGAKAFKDTAGGPGTQVRQLRHIPDPVQQAIQRRFPRPESQ